MFSAFDSIYTAKQFYWTRLRKSPLRISLGLRFYYPGCPHILSTLHPDHITSKDFIDVSRWTNNSFLFPTIHQKLLLDYQCQPGPGSQHPTLPHPTHGFLYYRKPHPLPEFMGHLRFRVTASSDPSTFKEGHDLLLLPSRVPWKFPILLSKRSSTITDILLAQLRLDGLIEEKAIMQMQQIRRHWDSLGQSLPPLNNIITGLGQEFIFDFTLPSQDFWIIKFSAEGKLQAGRIQIQIYSRQLQLGRPLPYAKYHPYPGEFFFDVCALSSILHRN